MSIIFNMMASPSPSCPGVPPGELTGARNGSRAGRCARRIRRVVTSLLMGCMFVATASAEPFTRIWTSQGNYPLGPDAAAADFDGSGRLQIVLADGSQPRLAVLDPVSGRQLWVATYSVSGSFTHSPVAGMFLGDGGTQVVIVSSAGTLLCVDGRNGSILSQLELDYGPSTALTVVPLVPDPDDPTDYREGVAMVDTNNVLRIFQFEGSQTPETLHQIRLPGPSDNSLAVARLGDAFPDPALIALTERGRLRVVTITPGAETDSPLIALLRDTPIKTTLAVGDLNGDAFDDIVVADDRGWLHAFTAQGDRLRPLWPPVAIRREPTTPLVLIETTRDGLDILIHQDTSLQLVNGATGAPDLWRAGASEYIHDMTIASPPSVFRDARGRPFAAFGDLAGRVWLLDLVTGGIHEEEGVAFRFDARGENAPRTTILAGPLRGEASTDLFVLGSRSGQGLLLGLEAAWPAGVPAWSGHKGGPWRTGGLSPAYGRFAQLARASAEAHLRRHLDLAREAMDRKDWDSAAVHAGAALALRPQDSQARAFERQVAARANRGKRILTLVALLGLLAVGGTLGARPALRRFRRLAIQRAIDSGDKAAAADLLMAQHRSAPGRTDQLKLLADLCIDLKRADNDCIPVYEAACAAFPEDDRYAQALAHAYLAARRRDERAAAAYERMTRSASEPAPWALALGQTRRALGEDRRALEAFDLAARQGLVSPELDDALAELHVKLDSCGPDLLPVLRRSLDRHLQDAAFLRSYCRCAMEAGAPDEDAERAADALLQREAGEDFAHRVLAMRRLNEGRTDEALRHAEALPHGENAPKPASCRSWPRATPPRAGGIPRRGRLRAGAGGGPRRPGRIGRAGPHPRGGGGRKSGGAGELPEGDRRRARRRRVSAGGGRHRA
jgi:hypothetical protein